MKLFFNLDMDILSLLIFIFTRQKISVEPNSPDGEPLHYLTKYFVIFLKSVATIFLV
ncbi:hypothetical protein BN2497_4499 [Janthinobacterium sp. CG23_2]|nr:hypothetical protein BN2497_4499 [Janthinobacterium sp. CG23_2]CUU28647.1 hypothetical protein BN3177_4499 [Janthinobacterium sp. CG23_2]